MGLLHEMFSAKPPSLLRGACTCKWYDADECGWAIFRSNPNCPVDDHAERAQAAERGRDH